MATMLPGEAHEFPAKSHGYSDIEFADGDSSIEVVVVDSQVSGSSVIEAYARPTFDGAEADDAEMDPVRVLPGSVTAGTGFTLVAMPARDDSHPIGSYRVHYSRDR